MAKVKKTKVGSEYRVRGKKGKVYGEFNKKKSAKKRAKKVSKKKQCYGERINIKEVFQYLNEADLIGFIFV